MFYAYAGLLLAGAGLGSWATYEVCQGEIGRKEVIIEQRTSALERIQAESSELLTRKTLEKDLAEQKAATLKQNLETNYGQQVSTINAYVDRLNRVHNQTPRSAAGGSNPLPESGCARVSEWNSPEVTRAAYQLEVVANLCKAFVVEHHCGIEE